MNAGAAVGISARAGTSTPAPGIMPHRGPGACPHGNGPAGRCSQCLGVVPRVVVVVDGVVSMDGLRLGTIRELNDADAARNAGIPRPIVREDAKIMRPRIHPRRNTVGQSRRRGMINSALTRPRKNK